MDFILETQSITLKEGIMFVRVKTSMEHMLQKGDVIDLMSYVTPERDNLEFREYNIFSQENEIENNNRYLYICDYETLENIYGKMVFNENIEYSHLVDFKEKIFKHGRFQRVKDIIWRNDQSLVVTFEKIDY